MNEYIFFLLLVPKNGFTCSHNSQASENFNVNHYFSHFIYIITVFYVCWIGLISDQSVSTEEIWTTAGKYLVHILTSVPCFSKCICGDWDVNEGFVLLCFSEKKKN